jgi:hypothetical protein
MKIIRLTAQQRRQISERRRQVNASVHRQLAQRKRRILRRIENKPGAERPTPMLAASNIHYQIAERTRAIAPGGIGAIHLLARKVGLVEDIDRDLHLLKRHLPYHESDHVLNIAYNLLAGGSRLEHLEVRRNDEVFLDALGAERIPDPTTAGDFCRRFTEGDVLSLMDICNETRLRVWKGQPGEFFEEAILDADGTIAPSGGWCKQGVDIAYNGVWGYHPLVISLANTAEPLYLVNRSGNRPSHEHAAEYIDRAIAVCRRGGFRKVTIRGDTDFTQTKHLDRWDTDGVRFAFGIDAMANLKGLAERLPDLRYSELERPPRYTIKTVPRQARERHKERVVTRAAVRHPEADRRGGGRIRVPAGRLQEGVSGGRAPQEAGGGEGAVVAARAGPLLLLHHQRPHYAGLRGRVPGQRPVRPGEPDRPAQGRGEGVGDAGGQPGEQLGLPGDGVAGLEPEGMGGVAAAGAPPVGGKAPGGEAVAFADGVLDVPCGVDPGAVPDRADESADHLPAIVMESVAGRVPAAGGAAARCVAVLTGVPQKPGSGCPGP